MAHRGFTLIELLIVVAIIAILAAIAVPNFLAAQTRAKVSRLRADMRTITAVLESYRTDWNSYPYDGFDAQDMVRWNYWRLPVEVSTPIAYVTDASFTDPFRDAVDPVHWQSQDFQYINTESTFGATFAGLQTGGDDGLSVLFNLMIGEFGHWRLSSTGPDRIDGPLGWIGGSRYSGNPVPYDPSNGIISPGDILRSQLDPNGYKNTGG
jgi:prepilin-type N-terminal cleavage/methylation domain-containing protein